MPRTITIAPDSGVFRASVTGSPAVTAAGNTEADALVSLAGKIAEHGWDWPSAKPDPVKPTVHAPAPTPA